MAVGSTMMAWISRVFSEADGKPSSRRILFAIAVAFAMGLATGALWLQRGLTAETVDLAKTVLYTTAAALGIGKFAEAKV
jgi:hypothetical protein